MWKCGMFQGSMLNHFIFKKKNQIEIRLRKK